MQCTQQNTSTGLRKMPEEVVEKQAGQQGSSKPASLASALDTWEKRQR
jgi:hypothetical protein